MRKLNKGLNTAMLLMSAAEFAGKANPLRMPNPAVTGMAEQINQPIYDSFSVNANTGFPKTTLFQTPIGQAGKTLAQTNMTQAGSLPAPQQFLIQAIRLRIVENTTPTDVINIIQNCSFTLSVGKKPYLEVPGALLTAGCGYYLQAAAQVGTAPAGSAPAFAGSLGEPDQRNVFSLSQPIMIGIQETFSVVINPETAFNTQANATNPAGVGTTVQVILDGVLTRGVQ